MINKLKELTQDIPVGAGALFFIQIFSTLGYAVLYSTLVLFMTSELEIPTLSANTIMGSFIAFNYSLHLFGGYFGGRFLSYRNLFLVGMVSQFIGCILLAQVSTETYFWGLACFLSGAGLNVTCINMMVTQLFKPDDIRRESTFLWNYSGMNIGFFLGFTMAGYFHLTHSYSKLFFLACVGNTIAILVTVFNFKTLYDRSTPLTKCDDKQQILRGILGVLIVAAFVPAIYWFLKHATISNALILGMGILMGIIIFILALRQASFVTRNKMMAYLLLTTAALVFWSLFQVAPMGLTVFAQHNVQREYFGFTITPQWIQNINTIVIVFGGPLMVKVLAHLRNKGFNISTPLQFTSALLLIGLGYVVIPAGISLADSNGLVAFPWIAASYVLQSSGELLISPIGYAMIGQLAPVNLQGIMMGTWMMVSGVAGVLASYFSNLAISGQTTSDPLITNAGYADTFNTLGWGAICCAAVLFLLIPKVKQLMALDSQTDNTHIDQEPSHMPQ